MSNLLSHGQVKFIDVVRDGESISLIGQIRSIPAFVRAVFGSVTARSAQSSCACLFILLYEDFWRVYNLITTGQDICVKPKQFPVESQNFLDLMQKLVEISMSFKEDEGGKAASMCLIIIWQCLQAERNFQQFDVSGLKEFIRCSKELFVIIEMYLCLQNEQNIETCNLQIYKSVKDWHISEINDILDIQHEILAENNKKKVAATTGNMRSGNVRNGRVSSLDL